MAFVHGKGANFQLGSQGTPTTLVNLSSYITDVTFNRDIGEAETTTLGNNAKTYIAGLYETKFSVSGNWDATPDSQLSLLVGFDNSAVGVNFSYSPAGTGTGTPLYTGKCILSSYEVATPVGDVVTFKAEFVVTGTVTRGTN